MDTHKEVFGCSIALQYFDKPLVTVTFAFAFLLGFLCGQVSLPKREWDCKISGKVTKMARNLKTKILVLTGSARHQYCRR